MRRFVSALVMVSFLAMAGVVYATPCLSGNCVSEKWTDTVSPLKTLTRGESYSFIHDIRDNGFDVGTDLVTSALLTIDLDNGKNKAKALIDMPGILGDRLYKNFEYVDDTIGVSLLGLLQLNLLGELSVNIECLKGGFNFNHSTLVASGMECTPVPEPGTFALLGTGLFAFCLFYKRRSKV